MTDYKELYKRTCVFEIKIFKHFNALFSTKRIFVAKCDDLMRK